MAAPKLKPKHCTPACTCACCAASCPYRCLMVLIDQLTVNGVSADTAAQAAVGFVTAQCLAANQPPAPAP